jgi:hypothetical protein
MSVDQPARELSAAQPVGETEIDERDITSLSVGESLLHRRNRADGLVSSLLRNAFEFQSDKILVFNNHDFHE